VLGVAGRSLGVSLVVIGDGRVLRPTFDLRFEELGPDSRGVMVMVGKRRSR